MTPVDNNDAHNPWFRAKVRQALEDTRPDIDDTEVEAYFAERRVAALRKATAVSSTTRLNATLPAAS